MITILRRKPVPAPKYAERRKGGKKYPATVMKPTTNKRKIKMLMI
jgi:hypothetical protein